MPAEKVRPRGRGEGGKSPARVGGVRLPLRILLLLGAAIA
jgi:hypothetical protein